MKRRQAKWSNENIKIKTLSHAEIVRESYWQHETPKVLILCFIWKTVPSAAWCQNQWSFTTLYIPLSETVWFLSKWSFLNGKPNSLSNHKYQPYATWQIPQWESWSQPQTRSTCVAAWLAMLNSQAACLGWCLSGSPLDHYRINNQYL